MHLTHIFSVVCV